MWERRLFQYAILLLLAFVWGSSFILMKIGLKSFNSEQAAAIRIVSAWLVLLPLSLQNLRQLRWRETKYLIIAGFIGSFIPAFLFTKAQTYIDSALAGMLNSLTPVFTLVVGMLFFRARATGLQIAGVFIGLIGAIGLISAGQELSFQNINFYALLVIFATVCYAININVVKTYLTHLPGITITSLSFFFIGPVALIIFLLTDFQPAFKAEEWLIPFGALVVLGIIGTAFAMILMNSLIRYTSAVLASSVTYIIPVFAILWGFLDHEEVTLMHGGFIMLVLMGVYLSTRRKRGLKN